MHRLISFGLLIIAASACDYEETGGIELSGTGVPAKTWLVPNLVNVGANPSRLGTLAGNVTRARYRLGQQRTAYLFEGDLASGISSGSFRKLPRFDESSSFIQILEDEPTMVVPVSSPSRWNSFRVYDSGECSVPLSWNTELVPGLVPAFHGVIAGQVDRIFASCSSGANSRFERVGAATLTPILRADPGGVPTNALGTDDDFFRFSARYRAPSIAGCAPVNLDVRFDMGFRKDAAGNIVGVVENVWSEVADFCIAESGIEDTVNSKIATDAPAALAQAVRDRFLFDPRVLGVPTSSIRACTSDTQCNAAYPWGTGHRCATTSSGSRECWVQLAVDRVNVRPEGVEFVLFENDEDPQRDVFIDNGSPLESALCGPGRLGGLFPSNTVAGTVGGITFSPVTSVATICG